MKVQLNTTQTTCAAGGEDDALAVNANITTSVTGGVGPYTYQKLH